MSAPTNCNKFLIKFKSGNEQLLFNRKECLLSGYVRQNYQSQIPFDLIQFNTHYLPSNILTTRKQFEFNIPNITNAVHKVLRSDIIEIIGIPFDLLLSSTRTQQHFHFDLYLTTNIPSHIQNVSIKYKLNSNKPEIKTLFKNSNKLRLWHTRCGRKTIEINGEQLDIGPDLKGLQQYEFKGFIELNINEQETDAIKQNVEVIQTSCDLNEHYAELLRPKYIKPKKSIIASGNVVIEPSAKYQWNNASNNSSTRLRYNYSSKINYVPTWNDTDVVSKCNDNKRESLRSREHQKSVSTKSKMRECWQNKLQFENLMYWIRVVCIDMFCHQNAIVLDISDSKKDTLLNYNTQKIDELVFINHKMDVIMNYKDKYNKLLNKKKLHFPLKLIYGDICENKEICNGLDNDLYFDLVTANFSLHHVFENEMKLRSMFINITNRLRNYGYFIGIVHDANVLIAKWRRQSPYNHTFGNRKYSIKFINNFTMKLMDNNNANDDDDVDDDDGDIDLIETSDFELNPFGIGYVFNREDMNISDETHSYLLHFDVFTKIARQYDLELFMDCNLHEFFARNYNENQYKKLFQKLGIIGSIDNESWDMLYLYKVFSFRKTGNIHKTATYPNRDYQNITTIQDSHIIIYE